MKKILIFLTLFPTLSMAQRKVPQVVAEGSFSIAALCKDGIVIGADTRAGLWLAEQNGKPDFDKDPICYYDTTQKIFPMKKFIICVLGQETFGDKFIAYYLQEYEKTLKDEAVVGDAKEGFLNFINANYPDLLKEFLTTKISVIGYENNLPQLCAVQNSRWDCIPDGAIVADTLCGFDKVYSVKYTCAEMGEIIEKKILDYAKKYGKTSKIGGPIMVLKISPDNTITWIKNKPTRNNWSSMQELMKDYIENKVEFNFKSDSEKTNFDNLIKNNRPKN